MVLIEKSNHPIILELMWEEVVVAELLLKIRLQSIDISFLKIITPHLLPHCVKNNPSKLKDWVLSRCFSNDTHSKIFFVQLFTQESSRSRFLPFLLGLSVNGINISDKFWLNPAQSIDINYNTIVIPFYRTTWHRINPFLVPIQSLDINQHALNDHFFYQLTKTAKLHSLLWNTDGEKQKYWDYRNGQYILIKRCSDTECEKEIKTLEFLQQLGVLVPKYDFKHVLPSDNLKYNTVTIQNGFYIIEKQCITDTNKHLDNLTTYCLSDTTISLPLYRMARRYNISDNEVEQFLSIIEQYKKHFLVTRDSLLNTQNLGTLVDKNGSSQFVVWGSLI